jgi:hypothetical protein
MSENIIFNSNVQILQIERYSKFIYATNKGECRVNYQAKKAKILRNNLLETAIISELI